MSKSEAGQEYVRLYYAHGPEISEILARDTMLKLKVAGAVLQTLPMVSRTLKGDTELVMPPRLAKTMQALAESIEGKAGPELKKDINEVLTAMRDESLLKRMAGKA